MWARADRVTAADLPGCTTPTGFPSALPLFKTRFESWSGEIVVDDVWTPAPSA